MTSDEALAELGASARRLAQTYTKLTEALLAEGLTEELARFEARMIVGEVLWNVLLHRQEEEPEPWQE